MKKFYSTIMMLAMMVAALSFTACGGDDDDEIEGEASIVGVWKCVSADYGEWEAYLKEETQLLRKMRFLVNAKYYIETKVHFV